MPFSQKSTDVGQGPFDPRDPLGHLPWRQGPWSTFRHMMLSWFGCGMSPRAPGTIGSLGSLPLGALLLWSFGPLALVACALVLFVVGWQLAAQIVARDGTAHDPQWIVIDEVVGQWIALAAVPLSPLSVVLAFALFRLFDIWKPWPVRWADRRVPGALGIMLDDLFAGLYAAIGGFGAVHGAHAIWTGQ